MLLWLIRGAVWSAAGRRWDRVDMPEFAADLRGKVTAALGELERARGAGDPEGVRSYENRLAYLRRTASGNGVDILDLLARAAGAEVTGPEGL
jgi:hypothetical protein